MNIRSNDRELLESVFDVAVQACHPSHALERHLPSDRASGREIVLGAGKAAIEMASVVNQHFDGDVEGAVVTRHGQSAGMDIGKIERLYGSHPIPDKSAVAAAKRIVGIAQDAKQGDRVHFLISGGGSALFTLPKPGLSLAKVMAITEHLVKSGLAINDINCVRRHLSQVSGGRLAQMIAPAELITYAISDVVGDEPQDIASGPTVESKNEPDRVIKLLTHSGYIVDDATREIIYSNPMPFKVSGDYKLIASASDAMRAVSQQLKGLDWNVIDLGENVQGLAASLGEAHAKSIANTTLGPGRYAFISGGELTVCVTNSDGAGGPNLEYLAALAASMPTGMKFSAIACDTDGIDGSEDNAGGFVSSSFVELVREKKWDIQRFLDNNQSYDLFKAFDSLIITGPTGTNVNDVRVTLIEKH